MFGGFCGSVEALESSPMEAGIDLVHEMLIGQFTGLSMIRRKTGGILMLTDFSSPHVRCTPNKTRRQKPRVSRCNANSAL